MKRRDEYEQSMHDCTMRRRRVVRCGFVGRPGHHWLVSCDVLIGGGFDGDYWWPAYGIGKSKRKAWIWLFEGLDLAIQERNAALTPPAGSGKIGVQERDHEDPKDG